MNPQWFGLTTSRGIETEGSKLFMRSTVLVSDLLVYIPALLLFAQAWHVNRSQKTQVVKIQQFFARYVLTLFKSLALLTLLLQPSLILIDNGHFQFNSVMLGKCFVSFRGSTPTPFTRIYPSRIELLLEGTGSPRCLVFCGQPRIQTNGSLLRPCYWHIPAWKVHHAWYKIGVSVTIQYFHFSFTYEAYRFVHLIRLGVTTVLAFYIIFAPFLPPLAPASSFAQSIHRIFPFARGIFEDKVANMWCATNVVLKWRLFFSQNALVRLSAMFTALGFIPSVLNILFGSWKASPRANAATVRIHEDLHEGSSAPATLPILPWALLSSSMSFFLFSFQVHEKTILLPLMPLNLLMSGAAPGSFTFEWGALVNNVAAFR